MTARRSVPAAALAALLLGGTLTGCDEDSVYEEGGTVEEDTRPTPATSNPGLSDAGTAAPIPTRTDDAGISGEERSRGEPVD